MPQSEVHRRLLMHAEQGHLVVRLHGGDPGVFGHLAEELDIPAGLGLRTDVIPAVTAAQAAAARAQAPLTDRVRGRQITFVSGHLPADAAQEVPGPDADTWRCTWASPTGRPGWSSCAAPDGRTIHPSPWASVSATRTSGCGSSP